MKQSLFEITENLQLTENIFRMKLKGDVSAVTAPGQFVDIRIEDYYLRRPISVCDVENGEIIIIYKTVGHGTDAMSHMTAGEKLDVLTGLGNGYDLNRSGEHPLLIGGGVGVPPLYMLAKKLKEQHKEVSVILGFNTAKEVFYETEFKAIGCDVKVTTADGSYGNKGFVTNAFPLVENYTFTYACGPMPMLKAVYNTAVTDGQYSFEERMGCGFGACMGCSTKTKNGYKRVCKDGPVFDKEEILWED